MEPIPADPEGLTIEAVEWLPSGAGSGLVRVRGRWGTPQPGVAELPVLIAPGPGGQALRHRSLPDPRAGRDASVWRAAYIVEAELVEAGEGLELEFETGARVGLPAPERGLAARTPAAPRPAPAQAGGPGGEVIDRAVLAERRARRAEAAEQAQARIATEALKAVEILELRGAELEDRLDALGEEHRRLEAELAAARERQDEQARAAAAGSAAREHAEQREAVLASALSSATALRDLVREWTVRLRSAEIARTSDAVRLAVLEARRVPEEAESYAARVALAEARRRAEHAEATAEAAIGEAAGVRAALAEARAEAERLGAELAEERRRRALAETELAAQGDARAEAGAELERARAETAALAETRAALETQAAGLRAELDEVRAAGQKARTGLVVAEAGRSAAEAAVSRLEAQLAELRARPADTSEADALREQLEAALGDAEALRALATEAGARRAELEAELETLRAQLRPAPAAAPIGDRIAESERGGGGVAAAELARRAERLASPPARAERAAPVVADLDAAAAALRARSAPGSEAAPAAAGSPAAPPAPRAAGGDAASDHPWLRGVLVDLAHAEPAVAARLLAGLLPAQAGLLDVDVDYDLVVREIGTLAITVAGGVATVRPLPAPRGRGQAAFRVTTAVAPLAEFLGGRGARPRRLRGPLRVSGRGRRRGVRALMAIPAAAPSLAEAARAGARLEPADVFRALAYAIHPSWTRGHRFTVVQEVTGPGAGTWSITVADGAPVTVVAGQGAEGAPDATVALTRAAFDALLRREPPPAGERPRVRGDRAAVALLKAWTDRAQGAPPLDPPATS